MHFERGTEMRSPDLGSGIRKNRGKRSKTDPGRVDKEVNVCRVILCDAANENQEHGRTQHHGKSRGASV